MSKKEVWVMLIMFFIFIFGLPLMSYVSITSGSLHGGDPEATLEILEEKKAILKTEHDKQIAENMKQLHDGTYKPRPWAGFPWNREE